LAADPEQPPKKKVPRRLIYCSDGVLEEYSTDEEEEVPPEPTVDPVSDGVLEEYSTDPVSDGEEEVPPEPTVDPVRSVEEEVPPEPTVDPIRNVVIGYTPGDVSLKNLSLVRRHNRASEGLQNLGP
jgi:hypothetical protein